MNFTQTHLFGVIFKVPKSVLERSFQTYMQEKEVREATQIGASNSVPREADKWETLKAIRMLEKTIHVTERKLYDIMMNGTIRPEGIPQMVKLDVNRASDQLFNDLGFDELDVRYNTRRLNLVEDGDYKALMAEELAISDEFLANKEKAVAE